MKKGEDYTGICIVYLCHDGNGNYLFNKRSQQCRDEHGTWDCGGGGLDFEHSVLDTLKKEILEEYRTEVLDHEFLGHRDVHRTKEERKTHWIALDYKVLIDGDSVENGEPHKFDAVEWFTLDALPQPLHSQLPAFFEQYKGRI